MKLTVCIILLAAGLACGWFYLVRPVQMRRAGLVPPADERPWRRVGAGICILLGVMFPLGAYLLDDHPRPKVYASYWSVMMVLVLWLCALALRDVAHKRKVIRLRRRRSAAANSGVGSYCPESEGRDP